MARSSCHGDCCHIIMGHGQAMYARFQTWLQKGVWEELFYAFQKIPDLEISMIDSTIVKAHACSAGLRKDSGEKEALGRSKGSFTTKIHTLVDGLGNPLKFILTVGKKNDITQAENLTSNMEKRIVVADKGYDANRLVESLRIKGCEVVYSF